MKQTPVVLKETYQDFKKGTKGFIQTYISYQDSICAITLTTDGDFIVLPLSVIKEGHKL